MLGQVTRISNLNVEVALPNNLTGNVSIVAISDQLTGRLEADAAEADDENSDEESDVELKSMFVPGQYLRVNVVSTVDETGGKKGRRKIELSLRPSETNKGLEKDDVVASSTVMAAVVSAEDHGYIMDLGVDGLRAFLPKTELEPKFDEERLQPGAVFLCCVTGKGNGKVAQLSLQQKKLGNVNNVPQEATTINTYLPGTAVDLLITNTDRRGMAGKIMGHIDATADIIHSGIGPNGVDVESKYKIGSRVKARVICNFPMAKEPKLGISLLPHVSTMTQKLPDKKTTKLPTDVIPLSSLVEKCVVRHVETEIGLFVDLGDSGLPGFVHISRVKDGKVDLYHASGPYQVGSTHKGRIVAYSELDGVFHVSFEKSVLEQQYLRLEDIPIGAVVDSIIEKIIITEDGVGGLIVKVAEGINGLVHEKHLSDVRLQHPERKFKEGMKVKARVLSTNLIKRKMRLTLKKTLVNSETPIIKKYDEVSVGMQTLGTIDKLLGNGAVIQFYGSLKGFLPISEMSEAYIRDPAEHFRIGQVVGVWVLDVDHESKRLIVTCKDPGAFALEKQTALKNLRLGQIVSAKVTQKTEDHIIVELADNQLKAILPTGHLSDKSAAKNQYAWKRISTGQTLSNLVVTEKDEKRRAVILSNKESLLEAAKNSTLLTSFEKAKVGKVVPGYVRNTTATAVFVGFAGGLNALLPKSRLSPAEQALPDFGLQKYQSIEVRIVNVIQDVQRIVVAPASENESAEPQIKNKPAATDDLVFGSTVKVKITSVKDTQLNVQLLGAQVQGRIEISQIFDTWDEIFDPKDPLDTFKRNQVIRARVMGVHDAKDHRFLAFSHRSAHSVLELTAKPSDFVADALETLTIEKVKVGETYLAFVNNTSSQFLWVNLSPSVRGRISIMDVSDDLTQISDLEGNFPIGSALKVRVTAVDAKNNRLDLSARSSDASETINWSALKPKMVLPGKITKVNERQVMVKLSESVSGPVHLPDMLDNYEQVDTSIYKKNDIVRVSIVEIDASNKRLRLSMRPSRILSSTLPVEDTEIMSLEQLSSGDIVRGFVKNVSDKGLFVLLGGQITALVKISNLSDRFLKEWKDEFQIDQMVKGRIIAIDSATKQVEMSLKGSIVDADYTPPTTLQDIKVGDIVTGKIRKVESFGAFILVDNSANVSGLCHRSEMAEQIVQDPTKLYKEGDAVKAIVLDVDAKKKRINFGLKPSYFEDEDEEDDEDDEDEAAALDEDDEDSDDSMEEGGVDIRTILDIEAESGSEEDDEDEHEDEEDSEDAEGDEDDDVDMEDEPAKPNGLAAGKKSQWSADVFDESDLGTNAKQNKEKSKKAQDKSGPQIDRTAELDVNGPQTSSDYERLLLGQPDSSELWIAYMAFQMQVSELSKAREVAERAIKSINIREEAEKLNVWVAYLNLEVAYGSKSTVEEVFKRACQYNDEQEVHERLASIYIQSEKLKLADALFESMLKKFGAKSPNVWVNYAHFLHVTSNDPSRARKLLPRANQQLQSQHQQSIMSRFAALEFHSPNGEPERGRTMFEGLLAAYPKKGDLWSQLLDLEMGLAESKTDPGAVRDVFERRTKVSGLKPQQAEKWFRRWAAWEQEVDKKDKGTEKVMAKAQDWAAGFKARKEAKAVAAALEDEEMAE